MTESIRISLLTAVSIAVALPTHVLSQPKKAQPKTACELLSVAEIKQITKIQGYISADEQRGAGGGPSCQYEGAVFGDPRAPLLSLVLIPGRNWTAISRKEPLRAGCKREDVRGLGDDAFFEECESSRGKRSPPLYVKVGSNDLMVQIDIEPPVTAASSKTIVVNVARAAIAKLR